MKKEITTTDRKSPPNESEAPLLGKPSIAEYLVFPFFVLAFLSVLIFYDVALRLVMRFFPKAKESGAFWFNQCVLYSLKILGTRTEVEGKEHLPKEGPAIIISNHQSMFDIPNIHVACRKLFPRFVAKIELKKGTPGVSTCLRMSNGALIDRKDPKQAIRELKRFAKFLRETKTTGVIFPEGTRARSQSPKPFKKKGTFTLLKEVSPAWVIPISIKNSWRFQARRFGPIPLGVHVKLKIHPPVWIDESKDPTLVIEEIEKIITASVEE